ncbi:MAG: transporter substrate-binding domain-containing protein [Caldilineaceae bacterium]|nr:transporter substrate-binding domain-containing protein [Caldilineaceae bacterium]
MYRLLPVFLLFMLLFSGCVAPAPPQSTSGGESAAPAAADDLLAEIQKNGVIRVSTDANYEPQSFLNPQGEFIGFDIDVAKEIAKRLGVEAEFVTPDWDLITAGNWGGQWDMSVGSMTVTTARSQVLAFAEPAYYYTPAQFAAAADSGVTSLADLNGKTICVGVSTTYETWLSGDLEALGLPESSYYADPPTDVTIIPLQTDNECAQQIQAGRNEFQAFLTSNTVVEAAIREGVPVVKVGTPVFSENLGVAFDRASEKDPTSLVAKVGEIIAEMHADGTLSGFSTTWFGEDLTQDPTK